MNEEPVKTPVKKYGSKPIVTVKTPVVTVKTPEPVVKAPLPDAASKYALEEVVVPESKKDVQTSANGFDLYNEPVKKVEKVVEPVVEKVEPLVEKKEEGEIVEEEVDDRGELEDMEFEAIEKDQFDDMDRSALKKHIVESGIDVKVYTKDTDDDVRNRIREAEDKANLPDGLSMLENFAALLGTEPEAVRGFVKGETTPVTPPTTPAPISPQDVDFVKDLKLQTDEFGNVIMTQDGFNKLANAIYQKANEFTMTKAPVYARESSRMIMEMYQAALDFYQANPDLITGLKGDALPKRKALIGVVANAIQRKNPEKDYRTVLNETAKEVRTWLKSNGGRVTPSISRVAESQGEVSRTTEIPKNRFRAAATKRPIVKVNSEAADVAETFGYR